MKNLLKFAAIIFLLAICLFSYAQGLRPGDAPVKTGNPKVKIIYGQGTIDTGRKKWFSSLVLLRSIYNKTNGQAAKDTSVGTAFLLSDNDKLYLVTAKNIITATQYSKSDKLPNDTLSINYQNYQPYLHLSFNLDFDLGGLAGKSGKRPAVAFTGDEENIAIISLQKKEYKEAVANLLAHGCTPVTISQLDTGNNHQAGERLGNYSRSIIRYGSNINVSMNWGVCYIRDDDPALPFFTINRALLQQGSSGSIAIANEKLIGIMSDGTEASSNYIMNLHTIPAKFTKSAYFLSCLRKLQKMEADPEFNN